MSGALKQMKEHVRAVNNIKKITNSMKVVAAAKFTKSEKSLRRVRPLGMGANYFYLFSDLPKELKAPHHTFVAVTSDRGLCGSMHAKVCQNIGKQITDLQHTHDIVCLGDKSKTILQFKFEKSICMVVTGVGHKAPTFLDASRIVTYTLKRDAFMQANIVFPKYINMTSFSIETIIMFSLPILLPAKGLLKYETDDTDVLAYLEFSQCAIVYYALCETYLVELSSRIMAMSKASKNSAKMAKHLQLQLNRKRQQAITCEILDIVSGAQAVIKK